MKTFTYRIEELGVEKSTILRLMGYEKDVPEEITQMIDQELHKFNTTEGIKGGYIIKDVKLEKEGYLIIIDNQKFKVGKSVWQLLKSSEQMAVYVCTAGEIISDRSKKLFDEGLMLEGYIVDVIGSVIVEKAMDKIHEELKKQVSSIGANLTNRYSPGYCDWGVEEQHQLFSFLPNNFCNVTLSENALMFPIKSISGFIGIGRNARYTKYTCNMCSQTNCIYRNNKTIHDQ